VRRVEESKLPQYQGIFLEDTCGGRHAAGNEYRAENELPERY
jgi:hypothetical protein